MKLGHLFLRDLYLFERALKLLEGQEPAFLGFGDQRTQLVELVDRRLVREKYLGFDLSTPRTYPFVGDP
ncbi:MAG: hypothetical protein ACSLFR_02645 [Solirubrobacteraceae bacterium]